MNLGYPIVRGWPFPWLRVFVEGVVIVGQYTGPRALWGQPTGRCNTTCNALASAHERSADI